MFYIAIYFIAKTIKFNEFDGYMDTFCYYEVISKWISQFNRGFVY